MKTLRLTAWVLGATFVGELLANPVPVEVLLPPNPPSTPHALVIAGNGVFYGFTGPGENSGTRGFFRCSLDGQFTSIPVSNLFPDLSKAFLGRDGNIYGFADFDGRAPTDALVRVTLEGALTTVFDFRPIGNLQPVSVFQVANGDFYVLSSTGGANNSGVVLRLTTSGAASTVFDFPANNRATTLVPAGDGNFYGVVWVNPSSASRTDYVFRLSPGGAFTIIHNFDSVSEGHALDNSLAVGPDGALYGLSSHGSVQIGLFRVTLTGDMAAFSNDIGLNGLGDFVLAPDGNFYAARRSVYDGNGTFSPGSILRISTNGTFAVVHQFQSGEPSGRHPSDLVLAPEGNIYGDSYDGGGGGGGTIFRLSTATGEVAPLHSFSLQIGEPSALTEGPDGNLYGSVKYGGLHVAGYIFRVKPAGVVEKVVDFAGSNGANPVGKLLLASDGNLYGTTESGGTGAKGTVFRLTAAGVLSPLFSFDSSGAQGRLPRTRLTEGTDGKLYGIAQFGGTSDVGTVFRISKSGAFELLNSFPSNHHNTVTPLTLAQDGNFYCVTTANLLPAAILRVSPEGIITEVTKIKDGSPSVNFDTTLVAAPDGSLYCVLTSYQKDDSVLRCTLDGKLTVVAKFPYFSLRTDITLGTDGNLYLGRYSAPAGNLARLTSDGISTAIATFPFQPGPSRGLTQSSDGRFYGVGATDLFHGSVFRAELLAPTITSVGKIAGSSAADYDVIGTSFSNVSRVTFGGVPATNFTVVSRTEITATAPAGADTSAISVTTPAGVATFPAGAVPPAAILNLSTRCRVDPGEDAMIGGFILQGPGSKKLLIRGLGPSLAAAGIKDSLANPTLELHDAAGKVIAANDDWTASADQQDIAATGIPPTQSRESAILQTLPPGTYTAVLQGVSQSSGVALVEIYDLSPASGRIANISTRSHVHSGDDVMIGGFILVGDAPGSVLLRAIGPSLAQTNPPIVNALANPQIEVRDNDGNIVGTNDDWQDSPQAADTQNSGLAPRDPAEATLKATLVPGNYTAIVRGVSDTEGIGLVEIYKLD
ncbi:MAG: hypothetical protein QOH88_1257 [Verrucomicrobiota bacterium]|jgi:uncharacterized repeat protein (TIGR03803 family)